MQADLEIRDIFVLHDKPKCTGQNSPNYKISDTFVKLGDDLLETNLHLDVILGRQCSTKLSVKSHRFIQ